MNKGILVKKVQKLLPTQSLEMEQKIEIQYPKCLHKNFDCSLPVEVGYQYCIKHILQDTTAPYKQCTFAYQNGKNCTQAKFCDEKKDSK